MSRHKQNENRIFQRYPLSAGAMVAITPTDDRSYYWKFGQIVDISKGGLAFEYEGKSEKDNGIGLMALFGLDKSLFVKDVPYEIVYNRELSSSNAEEQATSRCGLKFVNMSNTLSFLVDTFIDQYAVPC